MSRIQKQVKVLHFTKPLDLKEFGILCDILYEAMKGNKSACARALGISVQTWRKWEIAEPPHWPYWNYVIRKVILDVCAGLMSRRGSANAEHRNFIYSRLKHLPKDDPLHEELDDLAYNIAGAQAHLRMLLSKRGRWTDDIYLAANCGGYSRSMLDRAAARIGVVKKQEGYGKDKRSYWRLPNEDDD